MERLLKVVGICFWLLSFTGFYSLYYADVVSDNIDDVTITVSSAVINIPDDGDTFWISVSTNELEASWDYGSFEFYLYFDSNIINYVTATTDGTIAEQGTLGVNQLAADLILVMWYSLIPLDGAGSLVNLQFEAIDTGVTPLTAINFQFSNGATHYYVTDIEHGEVTVTNNVSNQVEGPTMEPEPGFYVLPQYITLETTTEDALIYYTLDGEEPDEDESILYTEAFELTENTTVKARAFKQDWIPSDTVTGIYYIGGVTPTAIITVESLEVDFGEIFEVELTTTPLAGESNIFSLNFTLSFDNLLLDYVELVTDNTLLASGLLEDIIDQNGNLEVSWSDDTPLTGEGTLLKIRFSALNPGVSDLNLAEFYFNSELYDATNLQNGSVTVLPLYLPAPENVVVTIENQLLSISWDEVEGATLYRIYGSVDPYQDSWDLLQVVSEASEWQAPITTDKQFFKITAATD